MKSIMFLVLLTSVSAMAQSNSVLCVDRAEVIVKNLVQLEFQLAPRICQNFDRRDCLEVNVWSEETEHSIQIDSVYHFGGNYPNQDAYSVKMDRECKVISIQVSREG